MAYLRNSILATVIYYDIFDYPLTLFEVYKYMINPARLVRIDKGIGDVGLSEVIEELDRLIASKIISSKNGFYFLNSRSELYDLRIERQKVADQKWKKFLKFVRYLALTPYLKGIFASGSMAINNTDEKSDFDVLIIAKSGRLYICRFFLWAISSLIGARRKKYEKVAPDKLCFNHYIVDDNLYIPHESIFNAQTYVNLKPVMIDSGLVDDFYNANSWLNNYVYNFQPQKEFVRRSVKAPVVFKLIAKTLEFIVSMLGINQIETILKRFQQERIKKDPATYSSGGRVVFTDKELEFHPQSFEKVVIEKYNRNLIKIGIISYVKETDSGLN